MKKQSVKILAIALAVVFSWTVVFPAQEVLAFFSDAKKSEQNSFTAGSLDFELSSSEFSPKSIPLGETAEKKLEIENKGNLFKYKISSSNFSNSLCDYANLEADINGGEAEYSGPLKDFEYGPIEFSDPEKWSFKISFSSDVPEEFQDKTCKFKFVVFGSQTRNNLPFGKGFTDIEKNDNSITFEKSCLSETKTIGYWKNHPETYGNHLPQFLGDHPDDEEIDSLQEVDDIFDASDDSMRNKLKKQLLAMKFNIAHFGIGGYVDLKASGKTLDELTEEADDLLRQSPLPDNSILEDMKDLLDYINNLHQIGFCGNIEEPEEESLLINRVYYDVDSKHGSETDNEWLEIYNPGKSKKDISEWEICDNTSCDSIPDSESIPAKGFALISGKAETFDFWDFPEETAKIVLKDEKIGNGLGNDNDMLLLKNEKGIIIDQMNWGNPSKSWKNYNSNLWDPGIGDASEGNILGRKSTGFDTNQVSDWQDFSLQSVKKD